MTEASPGGSAATTASLSTQNAAEPRVPEVKKRTGSGTEVRNASICSAGRQRASSHWRLGSRAAVLTAMQLTEVPARGEPSEMRDFVCEMRWKRRAR